MTKEEFIQVGKIVNKIVENQMQTTVTPLIKMITQLKRELNEIKSPQKTAFKSNVIVQNKPKVTNSLMEVLASTTPFEDDDDVYMEEELLITPPSRVTESTAKVLDVLVNTDFKAKLEKMNQYGTNRTKI